MFNVPAALLLPTRAAAMASAAAVLAGSASSSSFSSSMISSSILSSISMSSLLLFNEANRIISSTLGSAMAASCSTISCGCGGGRGRLGFDGFAMGMFDLVDSDVVDAVRHDEDEAFLEGFMSASRTLREAKLISSISLHRSLK